jgi:hypothetical protein
VKLTGKDIAKRYAGYLDGDENKSRVPVKTYACAYGLGCEGPDCPHEDCPRKRDAVT